MGLTGGQKVCLFVVILGGLALLAGSAGPFWITVKSGVLKATFGLWFFCVDTLVGGNKCEVYQWRHFEFDDFNAYFYVVHAAAGLASLLAFIVVLIALGKFCGNSDSARGAGGLSLFAGLLGITAAVVFHLKPADSLNFVSVPADRDWAFFVFSSGTGLLTLFGIVVLALPNSNSKSVRPGHY